MTATPQEIGAANQRDRIRRDINTAVRKIRAEILDTYDPASGLCHYDKNSGRVSEAEVLRRAGGVDKNTIKQAYHRKSKATVRRLVNWAKKKCFSDGAHRSVDRNRGESHRIEVERLSQMLGAAEARRDIAEMAAETAKRHEEAAVEKALALECELRRLRGSIVEQRRR